MQKLPLLLSLGFLYDFVVLPKKDMSLARLRTSSRAVTASLLGVDVCLPSFAAAIVVRARVALVAMVSLFIIGTVLMFRLKISVDFSASLTASANLFLIGSTSWDTDSPWDLPVVMEGSLLEMSCLAFFGRVPKEKRLISELTCLSLPLTEDRKLSCVLVISLMASHKLPKTEITAGSLVVTVISEAILSHREFTLAMSTVASSTTEVGQIGLTGARLAPATLA